MMTPYEKQEGWIVCATKLNGTMFFCEFETNQKKARKQNQTEREKRFLYWGRQFEKYMCSGKSKVRMERCRPRWSRGNMLALRSKVRGFKSG